MSNAILDYKTQKISIEYDLSGFSQSHAVANYLMPPWKATSGDSRQIMLTQGYNAKLVHQKRETLSKGLLSLVGRNFLLLKAGKKKRMQIDSICCLDDVFCD